jgi:hypothetical protein
MPAEKVLNLPLSGDEIVEIILQRIEARLRQDCFLHPAATYNGFSYDLSCTIKFRDMMLGKETLLWDKHQQGEGAVDDETSATEQFDSGDSPNRARMDHDMEIPVQTQEGRRTVIRKRRFAKEDAG